MDDTLERYMDAAAALHGIPIDPAFRPGVMQFLTIARESNAMLTAFDLPADIEQAPRFEP